MTKAATEAFSGGPLTVYSEDEDMFRASVREFAEGEIRPRVEAMDEHAKMDPLVIKQLFDLGLMSVETPEEYGGAGASFFTALIGVEELSRVDPSVGVLMDVQNTLVNNALIRWGSPDQKKKYLPRLAAEAVGAYALSEAGSGSDAFAMQTKAVEQGDLYVLSGQKLWITNGNETEIILDGCRVPKENLLGEFGKGYKVSIETLNEGRIGIGAQMIGLARGALEAALAYTSEREQFGKPINQFQGVQFQLAELAVELEAARLLVYNAARLKDAGLPFVKEAAMAKLYSSRAAEHIASTAIELYGGYGFVKDYPVEKFWRDSKIGAIYEGTSNMQLQTIAKLMIENRQPKV